VKQAYLPGGTGTILQNEYSTVPGALEALGASTESTVEANGSGLIRRYCCDLIISPLGKTLGSGCAFLEPFVFIQIIGSFCKKQFGNGIQLIAVI
jgi:hypothetical protein